MLNNPPHDALRRAVSGRIASGDAAPIVAVEAPAHVNYPHHPGYLIGCPACEGACHCGPGVAAGHDTECVWLGHETGGE